MKVLLVSPHLSTPPGELVFDPVPAGAPFPPLGLLYLSAVLKEQGHTVSLFDGTFQEDLEHVLTGESFDLAGVYSTVLHYPDLLRACKTLKGRGIPVVVGGPFPSCYPDLIRCGDVDFLVTGEGEESLPLLINACEHHDYSGVPGLTWKESGTIRKNPVRFIKDVDVLPFPDREGALFQRYLDTWEENFGFTCTSVLSSRGCPHRCIFCDKSIFGTQYRSRSVENIMSEIVYLNSLGVDKIWFADDLFTLDEKRVLSLCSEMQKERLDLEWYCESCVNTVTSEMLHAMRKSGCVWIGFGVESGNPDTLAHIKKGHTLQEVRTAFKITREAGIKRCAYFILGFPCDTWETVEETVQFAMALDPDSVEFSLPIPIPGTPLWNEIGKINAAFEQFDNRSCMVFEHPLFSKEEAEAMIRDAYTRFIQFKRENYPDFRLEDQW